jgi:hypothetical protein
MMSIVMIGYDAFAHSVRTTYLLTRQQRQCVSECLSAPSSFLGSHGRKCRPLPIGGLLSAFEQAAQQGPCLKSSARL